MSTPINMTDRVNEDSHLSTAAAASKQRKNRPGRSSRRRKLKARSIFFEATGRREIIADNNTETNNKSTQKTSSVVPSDRGYSLEGVKLRRMEEWQQKQQYDESTITSLDPIDEYQLKSQLGFVPGNAICVAARTSFEEMFSPPPASTPIIINTDGRETEKKGADDAHSPSRRPPSVLKLYPMAIREIYRGGTTDGRRFKGRRRGVVEGTRNKEPNTSNETRTKKDKKERCWYISPTNEESAAKEAKEEERDQEICFPSPTQHIIEPFPTLYWLTSPKLRSYISKMELSKENNVQTMERRLRSSQEYLDQMKRAHASYGKARWGLLTPQDRESVIQRGWGNALDERRGVAGINLSRGRFECVKCLHAHVAHYLAQIAEWEEEQDEEEKECKRDDLNLIGKWCMDALEKNLHERLDGDGEEDL